MRLFLVDQNQQKAYLYASETVLLTQNNNFAHERTCKHTHASHFTNVVHLTSDNSYEALSYVLSPLSGFLDRAAKGGDAVRPER